MFLGVTPKYIKKNYLFYLGYLWKKPILSLFHFRTRLSFDLFKSYLPDWYAKCIPIYLNGKTDQLFINKENCA